MGAICHHHRNIFSFYNLLSCVSNKSGLSNKSAQLSRKTSASKLCPTPKSVRWIFGLRNQCECVSGKQLLVTVSRFHLWHQRPSVFVAMITASLCFEIWMFIGHGEFWCLPHVLSLSGYMYRARFVMLVSSWALMWAKSLILPQCVTALTPRHPRTHQ